LCEWSAVRWVQWDALLPHCGPPDAIMRCGNLSGGGAPIPWGIPSMPPPPGGDLLAVAPKIEGHPPRLLGGGGVGATGQRLVGGRTPRPGQRPPFKVWVAR